MRLCIPIAACAVALWSASPALAQTGAERATARELGEDGQRALGAKDYKRAEDDFRRANTLVHAPTLVLGLARALAGEGKLVDAQEAYKSIIREGVAPGAPDAFKHALDAANAEVQDLAPKLGGVTIRVQAAGGGEVPGLHVTLDDGSVAAAMVGVRVVADPGAHVVRASADGFKPATLNVTVPVGGSVDAPLVLSKDDSIGSVAPAPAAAPASQTTAPPSTPESPSPSSGGSRIWPWVAYGVGGAGLVTGVITGAMAVSKRSSIVSHCTSSGVCPPDQSSGIDTYNTLGLVSTVGFVVAGVGAAAGTLLLVLQPSADAPSRATGLSVHPVIGPASVGFVGSF